MFTKKSLAISCSLITLSTSVDALAQEIEWSIETGLGYETNVYHAPDHDYIDYYANPLATVNNTFPDEVASFFTPIEVDAAIRNKAYDNADFVAGIEFDTDLMLNSDADDATRTNVDIDLGFDIELVDWKFSKKKNDYIKKRRGNAYAGIFMSVHDQVYVDHDSGLPKESGGIDLSDRYSYQSFGLKADYERKIGKTKYLAGFVYEDLNYDKPLTIEYDHIFINMELGIKHDFTKSTDLKAIYGYYVRDYSVREARNAADASLSNTLLEYTYNTIELELGHRFSKQLKTYFEIKNTERTDEFEGYNNYSRMDVSIRARYKYSNKTKIRAKIRSTTVDYDNAFNFEDNTQGNKENSSADLDFKVEHQWAKHKTYFVELDYTDRVSTDDRYDYTNNMIMLGAKWEY